MFHRCEDFSALGSCGKLHGDLFATKGSVLRRRASQAYEMTTPPLNSFGKLADLLNGLTTVHRSA